MTQTANEIVVGANGAIRVAPLGTAVPVDFDQVTHPFAGAWKELGLVSEAGVKFHDAKTLQEIKAWQNFRAVRRIVTGFDTLVSFALMQWNKDNVPIAFGGGAVTVAQAAAVGPPVLQAIYKYSPPAAGTIDERALCVDWIDGSKNYRLVVPKQMVTGGIDTELVRAKEAELPITCGVTATDTGDPWYLITNDPSFA